MCEENKEVIRRFYREVMTEGSTDILDEIMAPDFRDHGETLFGSPQGRDTLKRGVAMTHSILADFRVDLHDVIADGDMVGVRGEMRCIQQGDFLGAPASGNELTWKGLAMFRLADGRIVERWFNSDSLTLVRQLGGVADPA
jgi:predicted ester cyclase